MSEQDDPLQPDERIRATTRGLLDRYRRGEASALELLFQREIPLLRRWARGRLPRWARSLVDTADLVQDALARTLPHLHRFEPQRKKALQAYLRTAVANQIRSELRRVGRTKVSQLDDDAETVAAATTPADESLIAQEDQERYARALERLSDPHRMAVVARLELGYSYEQIALLLEKPTPSAARMTVTRAIARLIESMSEQPEMRA